MKVSIKKYALYACCGIFAVFLCYAFIKNRELTAKHDRIKQSISANHEVILLVENENSGLSVADREVYWLKDSLAKTDLSAFNSPDKVYFCFSLHVCPPCIDTTIDLLKQFAGYATNENLVVLSPDLPVRLRNDYYGKQVLMMEPNTPGLPVDDIHIPYFFQLDSELKTRSVHVVDKLDFKRTEAYIKSTIQIQTNR